MVLTKINEHHRKSLKINENQRKLLRWFCCHLRMFHSFPTFHIFWMCHHFFWCFHHSSSCRPRQLTPHTYIPIGTRNSKPPKQILLHMTLPNSSKHMWVRAGRDPLKTRGDKPCLPQLMRWCSRWRRRHRCPPHQPYTAGCFSGHYNVWTPYTGHLANWRRVETSSIRCWLGTWLHTALLDC